MRLTALLALVLALVVAGCGTTMIDQGKAEDLSLKYVNQLEPSVKPESASCPDDVEAKKGETFDCDVKFEDGAEGKVTVHIENDDGDVTIGEGDFTPPK